MPSLRIQNRVGTLVTVLTLFIPFQPSNLIQTALFLYFLILNLKYCYLCSILQHLLTSLILWQGKNTFIYILYISRSV